MTSPWDLAWSRASYYAAILTQNMSAQAANDFIIFQDTCKRLSPYVDNFNNKLILDIGCGRRYPNILLFSNLGAIVTGIDMNYIGYNELLIKRYWNELTQNGFTSFGRSVSMDLLGQRRTYYRTMDKLSEKPLNQQGLIIKRMNAEVLNLPESYFDLALSVACFEHIIDVSKAIPKLSRVLKPEGISYIAIHLYTSYSGSHISNAALKKVPPWNHLRDNGTPGPVILNRLREHDYLKLFSDNFEILDVIREKDEQSANLLTAAVRIQLSEYAEEELLTKMLIIIARKKR
jgi:SAM-dependent methyltransferase